MTTLPMKLHLWFKTKDGDKVPDHPMTEAFLETSMVGINQRGKLTEDEFEYLKCRAGDCGLIIHLDE